MEARTLLTLAAPTLLEPAVAASTFDATPQLRWVADPAAASYDVWVSELGANPQTVYIENGVTSNQISVPSNLNFQQHRFWVRSADAAGAKSPWSIGRVFSVTNDKPASLTAQAVTGTSANFQWSAVPGAESYTVWISQQGSRVQLINNVAGTTYAASSLATGAAHTFWVRAVSNDHTQSSWSAAQSFQTTGTAITSQRPVGVNPGTIQNPTTAKLSWGSFSGAASFRVWLNESNGTNVFIVDDVKNAEYWAEGLEPGKSYRYWVQAVDASGRPSLWSTAVNFSVSATERPVTIHVPESSIYVDSYAQGYPLGSGPHLIFDQNTPFNFFDSGSTPPAYLSSITVKAGARLSSPGYLNIYAGTLILEEGASIDAPFLTLDVSNAFLGKDSSVSAATLDLSGSITLGDNAALTASFGNSGSVTLRNQGIAADSDYDDLSDLHELYAGTIGSNADTDGDWLTDGFEVANGMAPLVSFGDPLSPGFVWPDDDFDGLDLLQEQIFMTDPSVWDTDGDGTSDGAEVAQGSDPLDHLDLGNAPPASEIVTVKLSVGDESDSHSERYILAVGNIRHQSYTFGVLTDGVYKFRRGTEHVVRVAHAGSKDSVPDFDYTALITAAAPSTANDIIVENWQELLVDEYEEDLTPPFFPNRHLTAKLIIPAAAVAEVTGDLDIEDVADDKELSEGGFVDVNLDDDDQDGITDRDDINGVALENDLLKLTFQATTTGTGQAQLRFDNTKLKIWKNANRTIEVLPESTSFAKGTVHTVYAEGVAELEKLVKLIFVGTAAGAIELDAVKIISAESILIAIDGTGSQAWSQDPAYTITLPDQTQRTQSHVKNFYNDYASPHKAFVDGPTGPFGTLETEMNSIVATSVNFARQKWRENPNRPIDIVGHSRGGWAAIIVSYDIANLPVTDGKVARIRFEGLYDPVAVTGGAYYRNDVYGLSTEKRYNGFPSREISLPANVESSIGVYAAGSSAELGATNGAMEEQSRVVFERIFIPSTTWLFGTHSAIGGAPWEGDDPLGHSWPNDQLKAANADLHIRQAARDAGVPISSVGDYGYFYLTAPVH